MAESESPLIDQTVDPGGLVVGGMRTVGAMPTVTSELLHVPSDKVVFVVANSGNELSFVSGSSGSVTSQTETGLSSRLVGAHSQNHAERLGHVDSLGLLSSPSALRI